METGNIHPLQVVRLSEAYTLKGSTSQQFLFNLHTREKFTLDKEQSAFLQVCNGARTISEILEGYTPDSRKVALEFLDNLRQIGAISVEDTGEPRNFAAFAPDPQLQSVHFELTSRCNMLCLHCYQESYLRQSTDLTIGEIMQLIDQMRELHVEKVGISGGEPLLHPNLFSIIRRLEESEIAVSSILTNGLILDDNVVRAIRQCRSRFSLFVSLDGMRPGSMELRGFSARQCDRAFRRLVRNIGVAIEAGVPVMINTVVTRHNAPDLCQMYDWLKGLGVTGWRIALPKEVGAFPRHSADFQLARENVFLAYLEVIKRHLEADPATRDSFHLQIEHFFRLEVFENLETLPPTAYVCDYEGKYQSCCIKPNGDVTPCPLFIDLVAGNIRNHPLRDIWYSGAMRKVKDIRICDVKGCQGCSLSPLCATGCRANAVFLHGSYMERDDDACAAVKFFLGEVAPLLKDKGITFSCKLDV